MSPDRHLDAVIVGGGHNGLVCSWYLAEAGLEVEVLERCDQVGGACVTEELFPGYRVSAFSYVCWLLQPKVIEDMELARYGFEFSQLDPITFSPFRDGSHAVFWQDDERTVADLARISPADARGYLAWGELMDRAVGLVYPFFLSQPPTLERVWAHAKELGETDLLERLLTVPLAKLIAEYVDHPGIQAGMVSVNEIGDPWKPGSAWTETYFHLNSASGFGYAVVHGGMGAITQAMARSAEARGVSIGTGREVDEILVEDGRAAGVRTADGSVVMADLVISNADPKRTFRDLAPAGALPPEFSSRVEGLSTGTSYLKFHSIMRRLPDLSRYLGPDPDPGHCGYIKIAPTLECFRVAYAQVVAGEPVAEPIVHIQIPTVHDSSLTEEEGEIVSIWAQFAPPRLSHGTWEERRAEVGEALIDYVAGFIPNFRDDMLEWQLFTPADIESRVGMTDGNIRHLDTVPDQYLGQRPLQGCGYGTPIEGLYLCGAGTHPGGEVTGAPGHNAAQAVLARSSETA